MQVSVVSLDVKCSGYYVFRMSSEAARLRKVQERASRVAKAILEIIKSGYERMAEKAISVLRPIDVC